jgi:16S rRNA (cytosine1407-C5)-methyltransferase
MTRKKKRTPPSAPASAPIESALARFQPLLAAEDYQLLLSELDKPLYAALRANPLKCDPAVDLPIWAQRYGWQLEKVPYCPAGRRVIQAETPISATPEHRLGFYYIQDAASMLPPELFDFNPHDAPLVLDLAASPGGKTTHITARTGDRGLVIANDSSADRITALRIVLSTWGSINNAITRFPGEKFGAWFPETFDYVLLDAPCSMQGIRTTESHPMRAITDREINSLSTRQARLLASAFQALRPGGQVVYSTCTLTPDEDEGVLDALLCQFPGALQIENLQSRLPVPAPALAGDGERAFDPAVQGAARLWPHRFGTSGFFAALITKTASVDAPTMEPPYRPLDRTGFEPLSSAAANEMIRFFRDAYGFDLQAQLAEQDLSLWRHGARLFAFPNIYLNRFAGLPVQSLGLPLGDESTGQFQLAHEWAARFGLRFQNGVVTLEDIQAQAWLRGEDLPLSTSHPDGATLVIRDEFNRNLGRGRVQAGNLKNLYPKR